MHYKSWQRRVKYFTVQTREKLGTYCQKFFFVTFGKKSAWKTRNVGKNIIKIVPSTF